ncbi:MAG: BatD family protein [Gemmatimonadales bacterium]
MIPSLLLGAGPSALLGAGMLLALAQGDGPRLDAVVDEDRVAVGEELVYTLRAISHSPVPLQVTVAPFTGLEVVSRSERTEVALGGDPTRTTVLEVRLRAVRPGRWQLGPARAIQGRDTVETAALTVDVSANRAATTSALNPRLRRQLDRAIPPAPGQASVDLLVSTDSVLVGEQVDVVTAAWFPRDLRLQLRRPPTLQPPVIDAVWSYPQATPAGIAATRNIRGRWYDLFLAHQVIFPLVPGTVAIPRATLKYSTPMALQFFSQEERFALTSRAETLVVQPLPATGRPAGFTGAIALALQLDRRLSPAAVRVGEAITVELVLSGEGNTALWPAPEVRWPAGSRAYVERVDEQVTTTNGRVGGTKTFRYLLVPDSAGTLALPAIEYGYFDLAQRQYVAVGVPFASVSVAPGGETAASTALPPSLLSSRAPGLGWRLGHWVPDWLWVVVLVAPPLALAMRGRLPRPRARTAVEARNDLRSAERKLDAVVCSLVPDPERRFGAGLVAAVRAAGADAELAARVAAARERLFARRYGPHAALAQDHALTAEVDELVRRLGGSLRGWAARGAVIAAAALGFSAGRTAAHAPPPEALYQAGSLSAAAEGFGRRAAVEPGVAAHWYNLGATFYRLGLDGRASAAWHQARRLDPRDAAVRRALRLTPAADAISARWTWSPPVTAEELLLLGSLGWIAGWIGWGVRPRLRERWVVILVFAGCAVLGGLALRAWQRRPLAIVLDRTTLRLSPHGRAPAIVPLETGSAVRVLRQDPGWLLVRGPGAQEGWVAGEAVARVGG